MQKLILLSLVFLAPLAGGCSDDTAPGPDLGISDLANADLSATQQIDMPKVDLTPVLTALSLPGDGAIIPGANTALVVTGTYGGTMKDVSAQATLHSSNTAVVSTTGAQIEGVAAGTAQITASLDGIDSAPITITVKTVSSLAVTVPDGSTFILVNSNGPAVQMKAIATFSDTTTADVTKNKQIMWSSTTAPVAAVSMGGLATPSNNTGFTNIAATYGGKANMAGMQVQ